MTTNAKPAAGLHTMKLRKVGAKQREWTDKRDAAIVRAHREGASLRAIADAVGMSHMGVKRIVQRETRGDV